MLSSPPIIYPIALPPQPWLPVISFQTRNDPHPLHILECHRCISTRPSMSYSSALLTRNPIGGFGHSLCNIQTGEYLQAYKIVSWVRSIEPHHVAWGYMNKEMMYHQGWSFLSSTSTVDHTSTLLIQAWLSYASRLGVCFICCICYQYRKYMDIAI